MKLSSSFKINLVNRFLSPFLTFLANTKSNISLPFSYALFALFILVIIYFSILNEVKKSNFLVELRLLYMYSIVYLNYIRFNSLYADLLSL